jgi:hypothetical protein
MLLLQYISKISQLLLAASESCANTELTPTLWTVADDCGNTSESLLKSLPFKIQQRLLGLLLPLNTTVECSNDAGSISHSSAFPIATDLCDATVTNISKVSGAFVASMNLVLMQELIPTLDCTDDCGNTSEFLKSLPFRYNSAYLVNRCYCFKYYC